MPKERSTMDNEPYDWESDYQADLDVMEREADALSDERVIVGFWDRYNLCISFKDPDNVIEFTFVE